MRHTLRLALQHDARARTGPFSRPAINARAAAEGRGVSAAPPADASTGVAAGDAVYGAAASAAGAAPFAAVAGGGVDFGPSPSGELAGAAHALPGGAHMIAAGFAPVAIARHADASRSNVQAQPARPPASASASNEAGAEAEVQGRSVGRASRTDSAFAAATADRAALAGRPAPPPASAGAGGSAASSAGPDAVAVPIPAQSTGPSPGPDPTPATRSGPAAAAAASSGPDPGQLPQSPLFHASDVLFASHSNAFFTVPWFVAVDRPRNALVVSVRGTLSLADCITDAVAQPFSIGDEIEGGKLGLQNILQTRASAAAARDSRRGTSDAASDAHSHHSSGTGHGHGHHPRRRHHREHHGHAHAHAGDREDDEAYHAGSETHGPFVHGGMWAAAKDIRALLAEHGLLETAYAGPGGFAWPPAPTSSSTPHFASPKASSGQTRMGELAPAHTAVSIAFAGANTSASPGDTASLRAGSQRPLLPSAGSAADADRDKAVPLLSSTDRADTPPLPHPPLVAEAAGAGTGTAARSGAETGEGKGEGEVVGGALNSSDADSAFAVAVRPGHPSESGSEHSHVHAHAQSQSRGRDAAPADAASMRRMCDGREPNLQLIICGHSLGAGVAALLSLLLRPYFPRVRCYAFSPPGALVSPDLARVMEGWVTTVVVGKDMVPRMSLATLTGLLGELVDYTSRCKVSKNTLLATAGVACCANTGPQACRVCCHPRAVRLCCSAVCCCGACDAVCGKHGCGEGASVGLDTLSPRADRLPRALIPSQSEDVNGADTSAAAAHGAVTLRFASESEVEAGADAGGAAGGEHGSRVYASAVGGEAEALPTPHSHAHAHAHEQALREARSHPDLRRAPVLDTSELLMPQGTPLPDTEFARALAALKATRSRLQPWSDEAWLRDQRAQRMQRRKTRKVQMQMQTQRQEAGAAAAAPEAATPRPATAVHFDADIDADAESAVGVTVADPAFGGSGHDARSRSDSVGHSSVSSASGCHSSSEDEYLQDLMTAGPSTTAEAKAEADADVEAEAEAASGSSDRAEQRRRRRLALAADSRGPARVGTRLHTRSRPHAHAHTHTHAHRHAGAGGGVSVPAEPRDVASDVATRGRAVSDIAAAVLATSWAAGAKMHADAALASAHAHAAAPGAGAHGNDRASHAAAAARSEVLGGESAPASAATASAARDALVATGASGTAAAAPASTPAPTPARAFDRHTSLEGRGAIVAVAPTSGSASAQASSAAMRLSTLASLSLAQGAGAGAGAGTRLPSPTSPAARAQRRLLLSQRMYVPGRVLHLVKVDAQPGDVCSLACRAACGRRRQQHAYARAGAQTQTQTHASGANTSSSSSTAPETHSDWSRYFWPDLFASIFCCPCRRTRIIYEPRWAPRRALARILVSTDMVREHLPDVVQAALQEAVADVHSGLAFGAEE